METQNIVRLVPNNITICILSGNNINVISQKNNDLIIGYASKIDSYWKVYMPSEKLTAIYYPDSYIEDHRSLAAYTVYFDELHLVSLIDNAVD